MPQYYKYFLFNKTFATLKNIKSFTFTKSQPQSYWFTLLGYTFSQKQIEKYIFIYKVNSFLFFLIVFW